MQQLQQSLGQRLPAWLGSTRPKLARSILRFTGIDSVQDFLDRHGELPTFAFIDEALRHLDCRYQVDHIERERVPVDGPVVIVANHPLGALDALALIHFVGQVRRDLKVLANDWLLQLAPLAPLLLPVPVLGQGNGTTAWRGARAALGRGEALLVFPAGEVSRLGISGVRDRPWSPGFLRLAATAQAPLVPIHIGGRNSLSFYGLSLLAKPLGTVLLPRQLHRLGQTRLPLRVGRLEPAPPRELDKTALKQECERIRRVVYSLPRSRRECGLAAVAGPSDARALIRAVAACELLGHTPDGKEIRLAKVDLDSPLLAEIGRMRETAFRAVGEGSGRSRDLDRYDPYYEQLLLWDPQQLELVGAYRLGRCAELIAAGGGYRLYSASLFDFDPTLMQQLPQALELGRSFVQPRYWNSRSLEYLWFGIGAYLRRNPQLRYLFGPVSISAVLPEQARDLLVGYYSQYYGGSHGQARAFHPYQYSQPAPQFTDPAPESAFSELKQRLTALGCSVPTLYKQYTDLCEPGGVQFLAFGVDPDFAGCTDGLLWLDLQQIKARKKARYIDGGADCKVATEDRSLATAEAAHA